MTNNLPEVATDPTRSDPVAEETALEQQGIDKSSPEVANAGREDESASEARPSREAAKYRRQLREVEAQRDELVARVETLNRQRLIEVASGILGAPRLLFVDGATAETYMDAEGQPDPAKLVAAVDRLAETYSGAVKPLDTFTRLMVERGGLSYLEGMRSGTRPPGLTREGQNPRPTYAQLAPAGFLAGRD